MRRIGFRVLPQVLGVLMAMCCVPAIVQAQTTGASVSNAVADTPVREVMTDIEYVHLDVQGGSRFNVDWNNGTPTVIIDDVVQIDDAIVTDDDDKITIDSRFLDPDSQLEVIKRTILLIDPAGNLIVAVSNLDGTDRITFVVNLVQSRARLASCKCFGNAAVVCTTANCDDSKACVTTTSGEERRWCSWRAADTEAVVAVRTGRRRPRRHRSQFVTRRSAATAVGLR